MKTLICPECKNEVDLSSYGNVSRGQIVECDSCGITLEIKDDSGPSFSAEIVDEGK